MATMPALPAGAEDYDTGDGFDEAFEAPGVVREHYLEVLESLAETGVEHAAQGVEARLREWSVPVRRRGGRRGVRGRSGAPPADRRGVGRAHDGPAPARARARRVRRRHARPAPGDRRRRHPRARRGGLGLPGGRPAGARAGRRCAHRDRRPRRRTRPRRALQGARGQRPHPVGQRVRPGGVGGRRGGGADPRRATRPRPSGCARRCARCMEATNPDVEGELVLLTDGPGNSAWYEHKRLAEVADLRLVQPDELRRRGATAGAARRRARPRGLPPHRRGSPARRGRAAHVPRGAAARAAALRDDRPRELVRQRGRGRQARLPLRRRPRPAVPRRGAASDVGPDARPRRRDEPAPTCSTASASSCSSRATGTAGRA